MMLTQLQTNNISLNLHPINRHQLQQKENLPRKQSYPIKERDTNSKLFRQEKVRIFFIQERIYKGGVHKCGRTFPYAHNNE